MSKSRRNKSSDQFSNQRQQQMFAPHRTNMDDIAVMQDAELMGMIAKIDSERLVAISQRYSPVAWEVELSYCYREVGIRKSRRKIQDRYVHAINVEDSKYYSLESQLPHADLDNSQFMVEV